MPWWRVNTEYSIQPVQHSPSTAYIAYRIHRVLHAPCTASSQDRLSPAPSQSLISRQTMLYSILYIPTITSKSMYRVSAPVAPPSQTTASRLAASMYSSNLARSWPPSASPNPLDHGLQLYLHTCSISAPKWAWSWPRSAYLQPHWITASSCDLILSGCTRAIDFPQRRIWCMDYCSLSLLNHTCSHVLQHCIFCLATLRNQRKRQVIET